MPAPSKVIEISDSDSDADARAPPPSSSQFSGKSFNSDFFDLCSSDDELPAPGAPAFFGELGHAKRKRASTAVTTMSSRSSSIAYPVYDGESSDEDESPRKVARKKSDVSMSKAPRKGRKTEEDKAAAKELKEQAAAQKKAKKEAEKVGKASQKADKVAQAAREKEVKKRYKDANKLVNDKKTTLKDMFLIFPPALADSPLYHAFVKEAEKYDMPVCVAERNFVPHYDVFSWQRTMRKKYDVAAREWQPMPAYERTEETFLIYMNAEELARCIRDEDGVKGVVRQVRAACGGQIFLMVYGLKAYLKRKSAIYTMAQIERAVAALQMAERTHLLYVDTVDDAVERLYNLSADLGIKPYKLIERSHLPFCPVTRMPTGTGLADTWLKMLQQVHRVTKHGAQGITEAFPTAHALFEAYEDAPARARDDLLAGCTVSHRIDGVAKPRPLGAALSQVVGTVIYGTDPLQLAYKAAA
ncbi:hypothetical protein B0H15DRAFT_910856 [Mycena belliarum]|uniref:ERCC4 domain-containing protein n=1 Tax=Mycena belliarum TaxID=1033014 RepID=A0AAD6XP51_9AGAR|nr:hypothetical protein B0H15DRAFT_910856 [Mycena belliae]